MSGQFRQPSFKTASFVTEENRAKLLSGSNCVSIHTNSRWRTSRAVNSMSLPKPASVRWQESAWRLPGKRAGTPHAGQPQYFPAFLDTYRYCRPCPVVKTCPGLVLDAGFCPLHAARLPHLLSVSRCTLADLGGCSRRRRGSVQSAAAWQGRIEPIEAGSEERGGWCCFV